MKLYTSTAEKGINSDARRVRVGDDSDTGSNYATEIGITRPGTENSTQGNSTCRLGILRSERRVRTRADSRQGSVRSLSPSPHAGDTHSDARQDAPDSLPSHDIDEESARESIRRRGVDDIEISTK